MIYDIWSKFQSEFYDLLSISEVIVDLAFDIINYHLIEMMSE